MAFLVQLVTGRSKQSTVITSWVKLGQILWGVLFWPGTRTVKVEAFRPSIWQPTISFSLITFFSTSIKKTDAFWCPSRARSSKNTDRMSTFGWESREGISPFVLSQAQISDKRYPMIASNALAVWSYPGVPFKWSTCSQNTWRALVVKPVL